MVKSRRLKPRHLLQSAFLLLGFAQTASGVNDAGSTDRPSATPLPPTEYLPAKPPEDFSLPPIPEDILRTVEPRILPIRHIKLQGNSVFSEEDLRPLVRPYEQRDVSVGDLEQLRIKLTRLYIDNGFINSGAVITPDAYKDGDLTIEIIEGRLDEIRVKGLERLREGYVINRLKNDVDEPFNLQTLQEKYQLLLSDPLIARMNGRILPGEHAGHSILDVDVTRAKPYQLSFLGNNQRPPSIGGEAFGVSGLVRNLTGLGDAIDFTFLTSDGSKRYTGGLSLPVNDAGTLAFFHFDEGNSAVLEEPIRNIDIESQVHSLEGGLVHPLIRTLRRQLNLGVLLTVRENKTFLLDQAFSFVPGEETGRNQATVWRLFQTYSQRWDNHALVFRSTFSVGMNALGATPEKPVPAQFQRLYSQYPDSEFFAWLGQAQYARRFMENGAQFIFRGNAQFSDEPLLPLERIAIGGMNTVRGYRENRLVRDQGYNLSTELHYPLIGDNDPNAEHRLTLIPFFDYGRAWNHGEKSSDLYSIGLGFEWQFKPVKIDLFYGYALNRPQPDQRTDIQDDGLHFQARWDVF
ncbi:MAG: ShlB/FhaC/HecB family hemolysin secretion/activation protein [Methylomonas sp.]|nr:ShlB/FhaC/HecB family hemolysin secretion/activation protein [Methylomonas sp.]